MDTRPTILVVDDDERLRERLARALHRRNYEVYTAKNASIALEIVNRHGSTEYAIIDLRLPDMDGITLLQHLKAIDSTTRVIMLTGWGSIANAVDAMKRGASSYLSKPITADDVEHALRDDKHQDEAPIITPSLARSEWEHIQRVLHACDGNISEASRRLGIHRRSLQRKLQKYPPQH